jgi:hypothetical protein
MPRDVPDFSCGEYHAGGAHPNRALEPFHVMWAEDLITGDYVPYTLADVGGMAELKWIAEYADLHCILMAPHGIIEVWDRPGLGVEFIVDKAFFDQGPVPDSAVLSPPLSASISRTGP